MMLHYDGFCNKIISVIKMWNIIKIIIGAAGWVIFAIPIVFSSIFNIGTLAGLLFFGVLFLWGIFGKKINAAKEKKWGKVLRGILIGGYAAFLTLFAVESAFMLEAALRTPEEDATLIVLGCAVHGERASQSLRMRIDAAEEFLKENPEAVAILSGGQGAGEDISEAYCMFRDLTERGIAPERLYMEDKSTNTRENVAFSSKIIKQNNLSENVAIVSSNYHIYRATLSVEAAGYECDTISAKTPITLLPTYVMREFMGILAQWIIS